jgi:hypothetical protein
METMNAEIIDREKFMRGLKLPDKEILLRYQLYHNYFRPHGALKVGITTSDHKRKEDHNTAWIDASQGIGELNTNDVNYAYKYLMMPENIMHIHQTVINMTRKSSGYAICHHPTLTDNN